MFFKILKIFGITVVAVGLLLVISLVIARVYLPSYFIPHLVQYVEDETNGRYSLSINTDSVRVRFTSMTLNLGHTEFGRDSSVQINSGIDFLDKFDVFASFQSLNISSFHLLEFVLSKDIIVDTISLEQPRVLIRKNIFYTIDDDADRQPEKIPAISAIEEPDSVLADTLAMEEFTQAGNAFVPYLEVKEFAINDLSFELYDGRKKYPLREIYGLDVNVEGFTADEHDDISVGNASLYIDSASTLVSKNLARLSAWGLFINPDSVHFDKLNYGHIVNPYRINKIRGYRAAWINAAAWDIDVQGLQPGELINDSSMVIDKVSVGSVRLNFFKDKAEPRINPAYKALPPENMRNIPVGLKIDTVEIRNADLFISMEAPKADIPGQITLNNMQATITNITNLPKYLEEDPMMRVNTTFKIMDQIPLKVDYIFDISSEEGAFSAACEAQPFDATILNGFIGSQFFIEFSSGNVDRFHFIFNGNNSANVGAMNFEYRNLKVKKLEGYEKYIEGKPKTGFIASVGNFLVPKNRSVKRRNYKTAAIYYEKEYNRDVIHGTIMAMLSGVMSSFGLSSRNVEKMQERASLLDESDTERSAQKAQDEVDKVDKKAEKESEKADKEENR